MPSYAAVCEYVRRVSENLINDIKNDMILSMDTHVTENSLQTC